MTKFQVYDALLTYPVIIAACLFFKFVAPDFPGWIVVIIVSGWAIASLPDKIVFILALFYAIEEFLFFDFFSRQTQCEARFNRIKNLIYRVWQEPSSNHITENRKRKGKRLLIAIKKPVGKIHTERNKGKTSEPCSESIPGYE